MKGIIRIMKGFIIRIIKDFAFFRKTQHDWNKFGKNNVTIALNVLYSKKRKINHFQVSKHRSECAKQFLMIQEKEQTGIFLW